jgi:hypothetical protein
MTEGEFARCGCCYNAHCPQCHGTSRCERHAAPGYKKPHNAPVLMAHHVGGHAEWLRGYIRKHKPHLHLRVQPVPQEPGRLLWSVWASFPQLRDPRLFPVTRLHPTSGAAISEAGRY